MALRSATRTGPFGAIDVTDKGNDAMFKATTRKLMLGAAA
jgi:hypothetical protein